MSLLVLGGVDVSRDSVSLSDTSTGELDSDDVLVSGKLDDEVGVEIDTSSGSTEVREREEEEGQSRRWGRRKNGVSYRVSEPLSRDRWTRKLTGSCTGKEGGYVVSFRLAEERIWPKKARRNENSRS